MFWRGINQSIGRHPTVLARAVGLGDAVGHDVAGFHIREIEHAGEDITRRGHRRKTMRHPGRKRAQHFAGLGVQRGNLDERARGAFLSDGVLAAAVENPQIFFREHRARLAAVIHSGRKGFLPREPAGFCIEHMQRVAGIVVAQRRHLVRDLFAVHHGAVNFFHPRKVRGLPIDLAGFQIHRHRLGRFAALEAAPNETHRVLGRRKIARFARVVLPQLLRRLRAKGAHLFGVACNDNIAMMNHLLGLAHSRILARQLARGRLQRNELALDDGEQKLARSHRPRAVAREARQTEVGIIHLAAHQIAMPQAQPIKTIPRQHAAIKIPPVIAHQPLDLLHRRRHPTHALGRPHCRVQ